PYALIILARQKKNKSRILSFFSAMHFKLLPARHFSLKAGDMKGILEQAYRVKSVSIEKPLG
ncbi:MAG: hypothetical protein ACK2UQ_05500, partial [Anaerolineae bacterium]